MKLLTTIKQERLPLIKAAALRMMQSKGKVNVTYKPKPPDKVMEVIPLTREEKEYCGIL